MEKIASAIQVAKIAAELNKHWQEKMDAAVAAAYEDAANLLANGDGAYIARFDAIRSIRSRAREVAREAEKEGKA